MASKKGPSLTAGKQGMKNAYGKSKAKTGLKWWERLLWVTLAGAAYAASALLGGCGHNVDFNSGPHGGLQRRLLPGH